MPDPDKAHADFDSLARDVEAWDGSAESASILRQRLRDLIPLGRAPGSAAEAVLSLLRDRLPKAGKGKGEGPLADIPVRLETFSTTWKVDAGVWAAPFLGDSAAGPWPYEDCWNISDEDGAKWARLLGRHALVDEAVKRLLLVFFLHRRRPIWLPASEGLACALRRDGPLRDLISPMWERYFPRLPKGRIPGPGWVSTEVRTKLWPAKDEKKAEEKRKGKGPGKGEEKEANGEPGGTWEDEREHAAHVGRHLVHLASCFEATRRDGETTPFTGFSAEWLASIRLRVGEPGKEKEADRTDASILLLCFEALVQNDRTAGSVLPVIPDRVSETGANEQTDEALRALARALEAREAGEAGTTALGAVLERLRKPAWRTEPDWKKRADALWGWLETAAWFRERGDAGSTDRMRELAPEAERSLDLALGGAFPGDAEDPVPVILPTLSTVLDGDVFLTVSPAARALSLVESVLFLGRRELSGLPWRSLVARAAGRDSARLESDVTVGEAGEVRIALLPHVREAAPALLLRDRRLTPAETLSLASEKNGYVAGQVAVQVERQLREAVATGGRIERPTREHQIALLWRLLQRNPPNETFSQLKVMLRGLPRSLGGPPSPLTAVVGAVLELDSLRDRMDTGLLGRDGGGRDVQLVAKA